VKKKVAIFSFVRISENSMVASVRIARYLSAVLQAPLVWDETIGDMRDLDVLVIVNGAYGFSKQLENLSHAITGAKQIVWVQNDYTIIPPRTDGDAKSPFRKAFVDRKADGKPDTSFWSTCHKWSERPGSHYVNWNVLTFDKDYDPKLIAKRRVTATDSLFYYGSYRDGSGKSSRVPLFDRYFKEPAVPTVISSPVDHFKNRFPKVMTHGAITDNFYGVLGTHGLGLYIEDRKSSEEFHSPANRFYEMLSAGLPMVFAQECGGMLRTAGFDPQPFVVTNGAGMKRAMAEREEIGEEQRKRWVLDPLKFARTLETQISVARKAVGL
jgi:hypothetical protein